MKEILFYFIIFEKFLKKVILTNRMISKSKRRNFILSMHNVVKITPLGGLGEIGKNITLLETEDSILIIDCGSSFPTEETPGIEKVMPDITYLINNQAKIKGLILTHGHEDHIGGVEYLISKINVFFPIYATKMTAELLKDKVSDKRTKLNITVVKPGQKKKICDDFEVEFIHVNHSIPGAVALAIKTPVGYMVHTGDFKVDLSPINDVPINLTRFGEIGKKGVKLLMMDSTNVEKPGCSVSEGTVARTLSAIFEKKKKSRIIIATFSSNISRIVKIIELAQKYDRKIAFTGKSLESSLKIALKLKFNDLNDDNIIDIKHINDYPPEKVVIVATGAQGELSAALSRMANGIHNAVTLMRGDTVIISSNPIPGNEKAIDNIINKLYERGITVFHGGNAEVHASGHANIEEQKLILSLVQPEYFMPVHGEPLHLRSSKKNALRLGIPAEKIILTTNGHPISVSENGIKREKVVPFGEVYLDGKYLNELNPAVIKDRQILMNDGVFVISALIDKNEYKLIEPVNINSRGFIFMNDSFSLIKYVQNIVTAEIESLLKSKTSIGDIKFALSKTINRRLLQILGKSPMVIVLISEIA